MLHHVAVNCARRPRRNKARAAERLNNVALRRGCLEGLDEASLIKLRYAYFWPPKFAYANLITPGSISNSTSVCIGENMRAKIGVVIAGTALAMFVMGHIENLRFGRSFGGSLAWAQESDDQASDAASQDDDASQADSASQDDDDSIDASGVSAGGIY